MKIALGQIRPHRGDIEANIIRHLAFIETAICSEADAIFFPELSLTSYEPELADQLAMSREDERLNVFQSLSDKSRLVIGLGLPTRSADGIQISMLVFQPDMHPKIYSKQQLHADELPYFKTGNEQLILDLCGRRIAPAICYESLQPEHARRAMKLGGNLYLASVAKSESGIDKAFIHYPDTARKHGIPVLMVNSVGYCDNFESIGCSSAWNSLGQSVGRLDDHNEGMLVYDTATESADHWTGP
ncbi:MAG TPA: carbon-nitrogen hydrolase family protein [Puia sp.]|nr:carbon-nitrogen hydrolase family protein [Puia sp.]